MPKFVKPEVGTLWYNINSGGTPVEIAFCDGFIIHGCFYKLEEPVIGTNCRSWTIKPFLDNYVPVDAFAMARYRKYGDVYGSPENAPKFDETALRIERDMENE